MEAVCSSETQVQSTRTTQSIISVCELKSRFPESSPDANCDHSLRFQRNTTSNPVDFRHHAMLFYTGLCLNKQ